MPTDHEWAVIKTENPYCLYVDRTGDRYFSARRLTDVTDMRTYSQTEHYEMCGFAEMPHSLLMRLPGEGDTHWTLEVSALDSKSWKRDMLLLDAPAASAHCLRVVSQARGNGRGSPIGWPGSAGAEC